VPVVRVVVLRTGEGQDLNGPDENPDARGCWGSLVALVLLAVWTGIAVYVQQEWGAGFVVYFGGIVLAGFAVSAYRKR
jgi:hypothetical protein